MSGQLRDDAKKMAKVEEISCSLDDDTLITLRKKYHLPSDVVLQLPSSVERVSLPPAGYLGVYEMNLQAGVRFPLPSELVTILLTFGISLSQFSCRAIVVIMGLILFFRERQSSLTPEILWRLGCLKSDVQGHVSFRSKSLELRAKDPARNWSSRFFFVKNEWGVRERWGKLKDLSSSLQVEEEDILRSLGLSTMDDFQYEVRFLSKTLCEERLFKARLSFHAGRSDAVAVKKSTKILTNPAKKAVAKVPKPSFPEEHKRKAAVPPSTGRSSSAGGLSPESPKFRVPDHILKRSCTGMTRANDLVNQHANFVVDLGDTLKDWNVEFVTIKYWLGVYKERYQVKKKEMAEVEQQLSECRTELANLLSSLSAQGQEVVRARDEAMEVQLQADSMKKDLRILETKIQMLEKDAADAGVKAVENFKRSMEFKTIIQEQVEQERDRMLDGEVKNLERQSYEEGFIRGFLKATRVVNRQTGVDITGITVSQASEDISPDDGDEVASYAGSVDVDIEGL